MLSAFVLWIVAQSAAPPAIAASAANPAVAPAQDSAVLADLIATLDRSNPELIVARRDIDVRRARVTPSGTLPDPKLTAGYMAGAGRPPFFPSPADPFGYRQIGISQDFPLSRVRSTQTRTAEAEVDYAVAGADVVRATLVERLKTTYVEYVTAVQSREIVQRSRPMLDTLARIAEARLAVGRASQQDVLNAHIEITRADERMTRLDAEAARQRIEINRLVARPADTGVPVLPLATPDDLGDLGVGHAEGHIPAHLMHHDAALALAERQFDAVKQSRKPWLSVDFVVRNPGGGQPWMTGLDFGITLPIFWSRKQDAQLQEATAGVSVARAERDRIQSDVDANAAMARVQIDESRRLLALYGDTLLPQARANRDAAMAAFETGTGDFSAVMTSALALLEVELSRVDLARQLSRALISLEPLVGRPLLK